MREILKERLLSRGKRRKESPTSKWKAFDLINPGTLKYGLKNAAKTARAKSNALSELESSDKLQGLYQEQKIPDPGNASSVTKTHPLSEAKIWKSAFSHIFAPNWPHPLFIPRSFFLPQLQETRATTFSFSNENELLVSIENWPRERTSQGCEGIGYFHLPIPRKQRWKSHPFCGMVTERTSKCGMSHSNGLILSSPSFFSHTGNAFDNTATHCNAKVTGYACYASMGRPFRSPHWSREKKPNEHEKKGLEQGGEQNKFIVLKCDTSITRTNGKRESRIGRASVGLLSNASRHRSPMHTFTKLPSVRLPVRATVLKF